MLRPGQKIALYMEGAFANRTGKMGLGVLRFSPNPVVCMVDSVAVGGDSVALTGIEKRVPIVATVGEAVALGAEVLLLGIAPPGGLVPQEWYPDIDDAVSKGLSIINGLHDILAPRYPHLNQGQWIWDVRVEPPGLGVGYAEARHLTNKRVLFIGTDMSVGKMTSGLIMWKEALSQGIMAEFIATGQTGIVIMGKGVPLDCIRLDYATGAIEREVLASKDAEIVFIEGQGSLIHPGSSANLPLLRGSQPTHLVMCHRAGMTHLPRLPWVVVPPLNDIIRLYQDLAEACGVFTRPKIAGVCLNTVHLTSDNEAREAIDQTIADTGLLCTDPVRFGVGEVLGSLC